MTTQAELHRIDSRPLPVHRLAAIWRGLPEGERWPFVLALNETAADELITFTHQQTKRRQERR